MKTLVSKSRLFTLLLLSLALAGMTSCKKDKNPTIQEEIAGDWEVKSFTEDGVELLGSIVTSFTMEYDEYSGSKGDFTWQIYYADGTTERITGDYKVNQEDKELEMIKDGETITMDIDVDGNNVTMEGTIDGFRYVVKAKRD